MPISTAEEEAGRFEFEASQSYTMRDPALTMSIYLDIHRHYVTGEGRGSEKGRAGEQDRESSSTTPAASHPRP